MRVCHIIGSYRPVIGGAERGTETLTGALEREGHDVIVLTRRLDADDAPHEVINGVPVHRLGRPGRTKLNALTFGLQAVLKLATTFGDYRMLHVQDIDTSTFVGLIAGRLPGRTLVTTIHGEWPLVARGRSRSGRMRIREMVRATAAFTSINPENTRELERCGVDPDDIHEIPNGIDESIYRPADSHERAAARAKLGLDDGEFVALYMGRLESYKRVELLIDAWSRSPALQEGHLLVVGTGAQAEALRERSAGNDSIRIEGPTDDPVTYLQAADVFVNASGDPTIKWYEGLSIALLEASFMGVPPIVTVGPGNDVIVKDGVTGLNFPVGDGDALLACLTRLLEEPDLRSRLGAQARAAVVDTYSSTAVARRLTDLYTSLEDPS